MSVALDERVAKAVKAILALTAVADTNFPEECDVRIEAIGKNHASITLPSYVLAAALKA